MADTSNLREQLARTLLKALEEGDLSSVDVILTSGADPNLLLEPEGISAMHLLLGADDADPLTITRLLLSHGGNPNVRSCDGLTPIHVCAAWGRVDILRLLLKYGGDPSLIDFDGNSVVSLALDNGHLEVVDVVHVHCDQRNHKAQLHTVDAMGDRLTPRTSNKNATSSSDSSTISVASSTDELNIAFVSAASIHDALDPDDILTVPKDDTLNIAYLSALSNELDSSHDTYCTVDEFLFVDSNEKLAWLERQYLIVSGTGDCKTTDEESSSRYSCVSLVSSKAESVPASLAELPDEFILQKLKSLGDNPGPVTSSTRRVYLRRLHWLQKVGGQQSAKANSDDYIYSPQLSACLNGRLSAESYRSLETRFFAEFSQSKPQLNYRGGVVKSCFNYLLMDPRVSRNLPQRAESLSDHEAFRTFVSAVFYVGKGQQARAYDHFYEALRSSGSSVANVSDKVKRIQSIWDDGFGVISLHCFQGTIAAEAFTREACMIDAIGKVNLTNDRAGNYYGQVTKWLLRDKCKLGSALLHRAMSILVQEGERQIYPFNLAKPKLISWQSGNQRIKHRPDT